MDPATVRGVDPATVRGGSDAGWSVRAGWDCWGWVSLRGVGGLLGGGLWGAGGERGELVRTVSWWDRPGVGSGAGSGADVGLEANHRTHVCDL